MPLTNSVTPPSSGTRPSRPPGRRSGNAGSRARLRRFYGERADAEKLPQDLKRDGAAVLAYGLYAATAQADPVTVQLFHTTFNGGANVDVVTSVTLNGSTLAFTGNHNIATTAGADGILFLPDGNLAVGEQNGGGTDAQIHEIITAGAAVANVNTPSNGTNFDGSYHLPLSSNSPTATLYTMYNGECGAIFVANYFVGRWVGERHHRHQHHGNWRDQPRRQGYYFRPYQRQIVLQHCGRRQIAGTFGTVSFSGTAATLTQILSNVPAHGLTFDGKTNDIIFSSSNMVDQFDPNTNTIVSTLLEPLATSTTNPPQTGSVICSSRPATAT